MICADVPAQLDAKFASCCPADPPLNDTLADYIADGTVHYTWWQYSHAYYEDKNSAEDLPPKWVVGLAQMIEPSQRVDEGRTSERCCSAGHSMHSGRCTHTAYARMGTGTSFWVRDRVRCANPCCPRILCLCWCTSYLNTPDRPQLDSTLSMCRPAGLRRGEWAMLLAGMAVVPHSYRTHAAVIVVLL